MKKALLFVLLIVTVQCFAERHKALTHRVATTPAQRIEIEGFSGSDIHFKSWENNEIVINLQVSISSSDNDYENDFIASAKISEMTSAKEIRLSFDAEDRQDGEGFSFWKLFKRFYVEKKISGEIYVPRSNPLATDFKYGSMTLEDMEGELQLDGVSNTLTIKNCSAVKRISNNYGKTTIDHSGGDLTLRGTSSTVTILNFNGKARIDADYSTVTISGMQQGVTLSDQSGKIKLDDIGGNVTLDANYSTVTIKNVAGFTDINSSSGTIHVSTVDGIGVDAKYSSIEIDGVSGKAGKNIRVRGQSGNCTLTNAVGNVFIDDPYSTIVLKDITGNVNLSSKSSGITAMNVSGNWDSQTEYCKLKLRKLSAGTIAITNRSDAVDLGLSEAPDSLSIENEYGDVSVRMPRGFSGSIDLRSEYGSVDSNFPLKSKSHGNSDLASGNVGSGKGMIIIETKSGNIELFEE